MESIAISRKKICELIFYFKYIKKIYDTINEKRKNEICKLVFISSTLKI